MKNAELPAMPATMLDKELAKELQQAREAGYLGICPQELNHYASIQSGLTKREHFAAMAMKGIISYNGEGSPNGVWGIVAKDASVMFENAQTKGECDERD